MKGFGLNNNLPICIEPHIFLINNTQYKMHIKDLPRISNADVKKTNFNYLHYKSLNSDLKTFIKEYANGHLVDIGCGNKPFEKEILENCTKYTGCDIVQSSLQKVDLICDATCIPLPSKEYDTVFCTQTIEHIADHQQVINEAFRLLKSEGILILSGPLYWPLHEEPNDYFRFTKYGYEHILKKTGFSIIIIKENGGMWATSGQSLIHSLINSKSQVIFLRIWRFLFFKCKLFRIHNSFFSWLDKIDYNPVNTMNYVVVAKKTF